MGLAGSERVRSGGASRQGFALETCEAAACLSTQRQCRSARSTRRGHPQQEPASRGRKAGQDSLSQVILLARHRAPRHRPNVAAAVTLPIRAACIRLSFALNPCTRKRVSHEGRSHATADGAIVPHHPLPSCPSGTPLGSRRERQSALDLNVMKHLPQQTEEVHGHAAEQHSLPSMQALRVLCHPHPSGHR